MTAISMPPELGDREVRVQVVVDEAGGLSGWLHGFGAEARPFAGMLELMSALETWRTLALASRARSNPEDRKEGE